MSRHPFTRYVWIGTIGFVLACTCSTLTGALTPGAQGNPSVPAGQISGPEALAYLTPNPLTVKITLDTAHAVSNQADAQAGVARDISLYSKLNSGIEFTLSVTGHLLTLDPDQTLLPAFGTPVTITPVSAIDGIPFSKGYLAAFQIAPEGLLMAEPGTLSVDLPGNFDPSTLVGFASDGTGTNFHLFPIQANPPIGDATSTQINFAVSHFSMYGVAQATASEILAQQAHPPSTTTAQDDDLLAAPASKKEVNLKNVHDRRVKPDVDKLDQLAGNCNAVAYTAVEFNQWYAQVQNANETKHFQDTVSHDTSVIMERLKDCLKQTCPPCLTGNGKPAKATADQFLTLAAMMQSMDKAVDNMSDYNNWSQLANQCAKNAGRPLPEPPVAACTGSNCGPTAAPPTCP